jgi:tetratricopeptide (TPR) repeat protein
MGNVGCGTLVGARHPREPTERRSQIATQFGLINTALKEQRLEAARDALKNLPQKARLQPRYHFLMSRLALQEKRYAVAIVALDDARAAGAEETPVLRGLVSIQQAQKDHDGLEVSLPKLLAAAGANANDHLAWASLKVSRGDFESARASIEVARCLGAAERLLLRTSARLQQEQRDFPALIETLRSWIELDPENGSLRQRLAQALTQVGDLKGALKANRDAEALFGTTTLILWQRVSILGVSDSDAKEQLAETLDVLVDQDTSNWDHQLRVVRAQSRYGLAAAAVATADRICAKWPESAEGYEIVLSLSNDPETSVGIVKRAIERCVETPDFSDIRFKLLSVPDEKRIRLIDALCEKWPEKYEGKFGRVSDSTAFARNPFDEILVSAMRLGKESARAEAKAFFLAKPRGQDAENPEFAFEVIDRLPTPSELRRDLIVDNGSEVNVSAQGDTGTTVVAFCGVAQRLGLGIEVFDGLLAKHGASAIYLRDSRMNLFLGGVDALGETRSQSIAALRHLLDGLNTRRILVLTSSGGGMGGLTWAQELKAERVLMMSSPTALTAEHMTEENLFFDPTPVLERFQKQFSPSELDNAPMLYAQKEPMKVWASYGADHKFDRLMAERIADAPGVTVVPIQGWAKHGVSAPLIASGEFEQILFG